jgi:collagenase-like PrtC family protease
LPHQLASSARDADIGIEPSTTAPTRSTSAARVLWRTLQRRQQRADIARLVRHAHRFNSRIFVTMNTILRDDELEGARKLAWQLYDAGVDALIIQDMGLLEIDMPPIQLHASTQTDIRTQRRRAFCRTWACRKSCWHAS